MAEPRLQLPALGEPYDDLLNVDSFLAGNTIPVQGKSLLQAKLKEKKPCIEEGVRYLARKRSVSFERMWDDIVTGKAEKMSADEYRQFIEQAEGKEE